MGFSIEGYYIGYECKEFRNDDGSVDIKHNINVATGNLAYRVYMAKDFDPAEIGDLKIGDVITLKCRVFVGKNGKLFLVDGEF